MEEHIVKELVAAQQSHATDTILNSVPTGTNETAQALLAIDEEKAFKLLQMAEAAIASAFYMSNAKRVARLEEALNIPVSDDKAFQMFYSNAEKDLETDANRIARKNKAVPVEITTADIIVKAQKRYVEKYGKEAIINEEYEV